MAENYDRKRASHTMRLGASHLRTIVLAFVGLITLLSPVTFSARAAPGKFIIPEELGSAPVKVRMGGQRFEIPANAFDGPHAVLGYDGPYAVMDDILLKGLAPNFELRSPTNGAAFRHYDCCIRVLISKVTILTPQQVVPKLVNSWLSEVNVLSKNVENGETHYVFSAPHHIPVLSSEGDIFVSADEHEATLCGRVDPAAHIIGPVCKTYSGGAAGTYQVSLPKADRAVRQTELSKVWNQLHSWMR